MHTHSHICQILPWQKVEVSMLTQTQFDEIVSTKDVSPPTTGAQLTAATDVATGGIRNICNSQKTTNYASFLFSVFTAMGLGQKCYLKLVTLNWQLVTSRCEKDRQEPLRGKVFGSSGDPLARWWEPHSLIGRVGTHPNGVGGWTNWPKPGALLLWNCSYFIPMLFVR